MNEKPEDVAKELEGTDSEVDDSVLEDVSGGLSDAEAENNNIINGSC